MHIHHATLKTCAGATGVVVAIDVIRAYTTAAYGIASGAQRILLTGTVEDALALRERFPGALVMGEVGGLAPQGFDLGNSPSALAPLDLTSRTLIHRTSAGTQGAVLARQAQYLFGGCFATAAATARAIQALAPQEVTLVSTGVRPDGTGLEDLACAEYLQALLQGQAPDPAPYLERARLSEAAQKFYDPAQPEFPEEDMACCLSIDRFDFALSIERVDELLMIPGKCK